MSTFARTYGSWAVAALFYCYQYILRVLPGNIEPELRQEFHLTAHEFGTIGSYTIFAYALMQIPIGLLLDRWGLKKTLLSSLAICMLGAFGMAYADTLFALQMSRILIGLGSASAFMSALKIAADGLPLGRRGLLMGATLTLGTVGAIITGSCLVSLISLTGWRALTSSLGLLGILLMAATFLVLPTAPTLAQSNLAIPWRDIRRILSDSSILLYALLAIGVYTPLSVLADLWGPAFLMKKYHIPKHEAALSCTLLFVGLSIGSLLLPALCERFRCLDRAIQLCTFTLLMLFGYLLYGPELSTQGLQGVLFAIGLCCSAEMMCFTGAVHATSSSNSGLTLGLVNTLNMFGGALLQQIIGSVLDYQWAGSVDEMGIRVYTSEQFVVALSLLFGIIACCSWLSLHLAKAKPLRS